MSLVRNERTKLIATALNNIAVATLVTALIAPSASFLYGLTSATVSRFWLLTGFWWFCAALILHLTAHLVLKRLTP